MKHIIETCNDKSAGNTLPAPTPFKSPEEYSQRFWRYKMRRLFQLTLLLVTVGWMVGGNGFAAPPVVTPVPLGVPVVSQDAHVEYWIKTLKTHQLKLVRKNAARSLGKLGNRDAVSALIDALKDPYPGVRVEAAKALGYMGDERAFGPLYDAMAQGDRELKRAASDSVDKIKGYQEFIKKKEAQAAATPKP